MAVPLGLNLAALAILGAVLAASGEPGGLGARWERWLAPGATAAVVATLGFRFPRSAGIPLVVLAVALGAGVRGALEGFVPLGAVAPSVEVQPLTDRELVTAFGIRVDWVDVPDLPGAPRAFYRLRPSPSPPPEWWWPWVESRGWARSAGAPVPPHPLKFGVYRLVLGDGQPSWRMVAPEVSVPDPN